MRVAVIGGTGLVGRSLLPLLAAAGHEVHALQRRPARSRVGGVDEHVAEPAAWPALVRDVAPEAAISCLGTTMGEAGSQAAFRSIDYDMVLAFGAAARQAGARRMLTVSSAGASPRAPNFYLALKGEVDARLEALGFERLDIFRPGLLRGARGGDRRFGERIGIFMSPLVNLVMKGPLDRYAAVDAATVAAAMAATLEEPGTGTFVHENRGIRWRGKRSGPGATRARS
jgi:uncharacterized protein YbjT (DUF2867 family)